MRRVAALYLPQWPIDRLRQAERRAQHSAAPKLPDDAVPLPLAVAMQATNARREGSWRPGARWAREQPIPAAATGKGAAHGEQGSPGEALPLVTALRAGNRQLVAAACPQARALNIAPGMAVTQARLLAAGLDIRPADPAGDRAALHRLALRLARRWTPIVAVEGEETLLLDLTGTAHLHGGEQRMARRLLRRLGRRGILARIAIADTVGAAWALSHSAPRSMICSPNAQAEALAPLPVEALRLAPEACELLRRLGIENIGQLAAMPRAPLVRRFGGALALRIDQALGRMPEPIEPVVPHEPIAVVQRFAEPIASAEAIVHWLAVLIGRLGEALAGAGLGARCILLVAERIDGVPQCLSIGLARPTRDSAHLLRLIARRVETIEPGFGIDALALHVRRADPLGPQPIGEGLGDESPDLAPLVDALANRIGTRRLWRCRPVESDVPERSVGNEPPLDPPIRGAAPLKRDDVRRLDRRAPMPPWDARWPRPVRLLSRPERLDHVLAELPDQPPRRFAWRGRVHSVVRADGPERIAGEWWRHSEEALAVRDYFQVEDSDGQRFWLFRKGDGLRPATGDLSWYLHGLFG